MGREIKFRAWDKSEKRMIYLATNESSSTHLQMNNHSWGVFEPDKEDYCGGCSCNSNTGDILMQYTGLKDNKQKEIYEGDIVKCTDENNELQFIAVVEFGNPNHEYYWGWQLHYIKGDEANLDILCWVGMEEAGATIEVIGNIYENPELLEVGKPADVN